jgi:ATP-dependent Clp protease ATP-binding subunit ClpA
MQTLAKSFANSTRIALTLARYAADAVQASVVAPEHVLGGLLREPSQETRALLTRAGVSAEAVTALAERLLPSRVLDQPEACEIRPYARGTKLLIMQAPEEARLDGQTVATPQHLLRALFALEPNPAVDALLALGVTRDKLRAATRPDAS